LSSGEINCPSDVYSFGVLLFECLSESEFNDRLPLSKTDTAVAEVIRQSLSSDFHLRPSIDAVLEAFLRSGPDPFVPKCFSLGDLTNLWTFIVTSDTFARGLESAESGERIVARVGRSADAGDAIAQDRFAFLVSRGIGCAVDDGAAVHYHKLAADQGNASGMLNYAQCLANGWGTEADVSLAARYYKMSADGENSEGMLRYGRALASGQGVQQDLMSAARYIKMSADQGDVMGIAHYGQCLETGQGVSRDLRMAADY
jgi:TPR repeat protein